MSVDFSSLNSETIKGLIYSTFSEEQQEKYTNELEEIIMFYDVYENSDKNKQIQSTVNSMNKTKSEKEYNELSKDLYYLIPFYSIDDTPLLIDTQNQIIDNNRQSLQSKNISTTSAIQYASIYSTSRNYQYKSFASDCTNFASQILHEGGTPMHKTNSKYSGWWFGSKYSYSISWINADTFARYMGVGYKTRYFNYFSQRIAKGDFISFDSYSDGDWNHIGYVTALGSNYTYTGIGNTTKTYRNFKVAQHTKDYHAWVSNSTNGWENLERSGYTYGRVRR